MILIDDKPIFEESLDIFRRQAQEKAGFADIEKLKELKIGAGDTVFRADRQGIWLGNAVFGSGPFRVTMAGVLTATGATITGAITATSGAIGGWNIVSGYIYSLQSGTPTSSPSDGLVLASGNEAIIAYENTEKRVEIGYLSAGVYGIKVYADDGSTVVFEASDTQNLIKGDYVDALAVSKLTAGTITSKSIVLAVAAGTGDVEIRAGIATGDFANAGAATGFIFGLDDSAGDLPKSYFGSPTQYWKWDGVNMIIAGILNLIGTLQLKSYTVATLPSGNTGWKSPTGFTDHADWANEANAYTSNNSYATGGSYVASMVWYNTFDFGIPSGATINGIEVSFEWKYSDDVPDASSALWYCTSDGIDSDRKAVTCGMAESTEIAGGASELWGRTPIDTDFSDANFKVGVYTDMCHECNTTWYVDHIQVKVYYTDPQNPIVAGSVAYASDGRKAGETAGNGTGVLVFYDGSNWIAVDTGATVAA